MSEIKGKLLSLSATQIINEKFKKREFVLVVTENYNGKDYENYIKCQAIQDRCELLDGMKQGTELNVSYNLKGFKWEKDGKTNYGTNIEVWKIQKADAQAAPQPQYQEPQKQAPQGDSQGVLDELPF